MDRKIETLNIYLLSEGGRRLYQSYEIREDTQLINISIEHRDDLYRIVFDYKTGTQRVTLIPKNAVVLEYAATPIPTSPTDGTVTLDQQ